MLYISLYFIHYRISNCQRTIIRSNKFKNLKLGFPQLLILYQNRKTIAIVLIYYKQLCFNSAIIKAITSYN